MTPYHRVGFFLEAIGAVYRGRACLTPQGADYMGIPFAFPGGDRA